MTNPAEPLSVAAPATRNPRSRVTLADVARTAQVSPMTVSYAYNRPERVAEATRARVFAAAEQLGYTGPNPAARSLRQGRFGSIGIVLAEPLTYAFEDLAANRFLAGVASVCAQERLGISLLSVADDDPVGVVTGAAVDAYLVWTQPDGDPVIDAVVRSGVPAGVLGGPRVPGLQFVSMDDRVAGEAVAEVVFAGARRPLVLSLPFVRNQEPALLHGPDPADATYPVSRNRLAGAKDWCDRAGVPWESVRVAVLARNSQAEAIEAVSAVLSGDDPPDAILAMSDEIALGALTAAHRAGVPVPEGVAISGWDGSGPAALAGLTTVEQSLYDQGRALTLAVLGLADEVPEPPWTLVRRGTTKG
jgi:DNA-binding LacI/PurR family transcriptional regulator